MGCLQSLASALAIAVLLGSIGSEATERAAAETTAPSAVVRVFSDPRSVYLSSPEARHLGEALRAAAEAAAAGDLAAAGERYAAIAQAHPTLADRVHWLQARARLVAGDAEGAAAAARAGLGARPGSPALGELQRLLGQARRASGDEAGARAAWIAALSNTRGVERRAPIRLDIAESLLRQGLADEAVPHLRKIWIEAPERDEAAAAAVALDRLDAAGAQTRSAGDFLLRADRLYRERHSEAALEAYERALALGLAEADRARAREQRAHSLFRLRRYPEAAESFTELGGSAGFRLWRARSLARADRVEEAIGELEAIGEGGSPTAAWARYLAALLHAGRGREARATALFESTLGGAASDDIEQAALWQLGWSALEGGDPAAARTRWLELARREADPVARLEPRFWAADALASSQPAVAELELRGLADAYPLSYYGWRARERVGGAPAAPPAPLPAGRRALGDGELFRAQAMLAAGDPEAAVREAAPLAARVGGVDDRIDLARLYAAAGDFHRAQRTLVDAYGDRLAEGPRVGQEAVWQLAWPAAYATELMPWLRAGLPIDPELVMAVMREESGYRPEVASITGALGLMQIMPSTGERVARDAGVQDFHPQRLLEPALNLRLGSFYLSQLSQRFGGSLPAAIASYNAGPEVVSRWLESGSGDADRWIASIPYTQTRSYVMRVLRSVHAYRVIYP